MNLPSFIIHGKPDIQFYSVLTTSLMGNALLLYHCFFLTSINCLDSCTMLLLLVIGLGFFQFFFFFDGWELQVKAANTAF